MSKKNYDVLKGKHKEIFKAFNKILEETGLAGLKVVGFGIEGDETMRISKPDCEPDEHLVVYIDEQGNMRYICVPN